MNYRFDFSQLRRIYPRVVVIPANFDIRVPGQIASVFPVNKDATFLNAAPAGSIGPILPVYTFGDLSVDRT